MNWEQVRKLASNNLFQIGGHSFNHDILTRLPVSKNEKKYKKINYFVRKKIE